MPMVTPRFRTGRPLEAQTVIGVLSRAAATRRLRAFLVESRHGVAAVEFAIVSPMLILVLVGVVCYGSYFGVASSVQQIAADAARATVAGLTDDERASLAQRRVSDIAKSFVLIDPSRLQVKANVSSADPSLYEVTLSYDASRLAIWAFSKIVPLPSSTIVRSAAIQRGGY